jgi:hypothetical protein
VTDASVPKAVRLSGHGIQVDLPAGWDGRIYRRAEGRPVLHTGTFPLPPHDADFGSSAAAAAGPDDTFAALVEYDVGLAGIGLFEPSGLPLPLRPGDFSPRALQRLLPGRAGVQRFFSSGDRAFCLYVVIGTPPAGPFDVGPANRVLRTVVVTPGSPG